MSNFYLFNVRLLTFHLFAATFTLSIRWWFFYFSIFIHLSAFSEGI